MIYLTRRAAAAALALLLASLAGPLAAQTREKRQVPIESLIYDLKNPDPVRRKDAAALLGANRVQRAIPDLITAGKDSDATVRREVVLALDHMADARAVPAFVMLMNDAEKDIRERAIHATVNLYIPQESGLTVTFTKVANFLNPWSDEWTDVVVEPGISVDPTVISALRDRLQDPEEAIRIKTARALGILRGREAQPALLEALRQDRSNGVRFEAVRAVRKIGDTTVGKELVSYCSYADGRVRSEAVFTIGRFRYSEALPELTRLFGKESALPAKQADKTYRVRLLDAIAFIADPSSKELFLKELKNPDDLLRLHAVEGMARLGDPSLVTDVSRDRLREKDPRIQTAQAYALYRMGRKEYLEEVVAALANRKMHDEAKQYLVELKPDELQELYAQVRNKDVAVRESLAEVFGIVGDSRAVPVLQELAKDHRGHIVQFANQALRRINARQ